MNHVLVVAAVRASLLLAGTVPAGAQMRPNARPSDPDAQRKRAAVVAECVRFRPHGALVADIRCYATGSQVRVFGGPEEQLHFDKGMAQEGQRSR